MSGLFGFLAHLSLGPLVFYSSVCKSALVISGISFYGVMEVGVIFSYGDFVLACFGRKVCFLCVGACPHLSSTALLWSCCGHLVASWLDGAMLRTGTLAFPCTAHAPVFPEGVPPSANGGGHVPSHSRSLLMLFPAPAPDAPSLANGSHLVVIGNLRTPDDLVNIAVLQGSEYFLGCQSHKHEPCGVVKKRMLEVEEEYASFTPWCPGPRPCPPPSSPGQEWDVVNPSLGFVTGFSAT